MKKLFLLFVIMPGLCNAQSKKSPGLSLNELKTFNADDGKSYSPADTIVFADASRHAIKRINKYEMDDGHTIVVYARTTDGFYVPLENTDALANRIKVVETKPQPVANTTRPKDEPMPAIKRVTTPAPVEKPTAINNYKPKEYTAINGVVYKVGGMIGIGKGSSSNGDFLYLNSVGWSAALAAGTSADRFHAKSRMSDYKLEIKGINEIIYKTSKKVIFILGGGNVDDYELDIDEAIGSCEVKSCDPIILDSLIRLRKLKADGKISEADFQDERKKILKK